MATPRPKDVETQDKAKRDWLELPHDVISLIFTKLGAIDILYRAQSVCSLWRNLCKQPYLFRSIDLRNIADNKDYCGIDKNKLVNEALDRSCGQLVEFFGDYWLNCFDYLHLSAYNSIALKCFRFDFELVYNYDEEVQILIDVVRKAPFLEEIGVSYFHRFPTVLLEAIGQLCPKLRCLRLRRSSYNDHPPEKLIKFIRNFSFLEELELNYIKYPAELIKEVGRSCTQLQRLRLDNKSYYCSHLDLEACGIAENIPQIRHLQLSSCELTNYGIKWILNRCTNLECLDIASCSIRDLKGTEQTTMICDKSGKTVRLPVPDDDERRRWDDHVPDFYENHFYDLDSLGF